MGRQFPQENGMKEPGSSCYFKVCVLPTVPFEEGCQTPADVKTSLSQVM